MATNLGSGSDPVTGFSFNLKSPKSAVMRMLAAVVGLTGLFVVVGVVLNQTGPRTSNFLAELTNGFVNPSDDPLGREGGQAQYVVAG